MFVKKIGKWMSKVLGGAQCYHVRPFQGQDTDTSSSDVPPPHIRHSLNYKSQTTNLFSKFALEISTYNNNVQKP